MRLVEYSRAARIEDFEEVCRLARDYAAWDMKETAARGIPVEDLLSFQHDYRPDAVSARYRNSKGLMLLVRVDGAPAACGGIDLSSPPAEIKTLYVDPAFRGLGIGREILCRLLAEAQGHGIGKVRLETVRFMTDAIALYQSLGFRSCPAYYEIPDSLRPITLFMECDLDGSARQLAPS
jgi:ribosomal protein S18 acetylase RimI-like enzyme